jgi:[acyl-carrier-protein] S-malonyltransferase
MVAVQAGCEVAIVNGPEHAVLGGPVAALAEAERLAASAGVTTIQRLRIATPAHTGLLAGAVGSFAEALQAAGPKPSSIPVLSGISGEPCRGGASAVACLSRQLAERLEWGRCLEVAAELGCTVLLDLGPGAALAKMARQALPGVAARAVNEFRSAAGVARWVTSQLAR